MGNLKEMTPISETGFQAIEQAVKEGRLAEETASGELKWEKTASQEVAGEKRVRYKTVRNGDTIQMWHVTKQSPEGKTLYSSFLSLNVAGEKRLIKDPAMKDLLKAVLAHAREGDVRPGRIIMPTRRDRKPVHFAGRRNVAAQSLAAGARKKTIDFRDLVVLDNKMRCADAEHEHRDVVICINMIDKKGRETPRQIPAHYCEKCGVFVMKFGVFRAYRNQGLLFPCQIVDYKTYIKGDYKDYKGMDMSKESVFMRYGYMTAPAYGLTEKQRGRLLFNIIGKNVLSREQLRTYLDTLMASDEYTPEEKAAWAHDRGLIS